MDKAKKEKKKIRIFKTHLLQFEELKASPDWQIPFHDFGIGPIPSSLKLLDSGHSPIWCIIQQHSLPSLN